MSARGDPLKTRLRWRAERVLLRVIGRTVRCAECGRPLFAALPVIWRGNLVLIGLEGQQRVVRVRFEGKQTLEFRHVDLAACPAPERPWVR